MKGYTYILNYGEPTVFYSTFLSHTIPYCLFSAG